MVVEAAAVISIISGTVSTINTVKGWLIDIAKLCQNFKDSGNTIQDLSENFKAFGSDLGLWMEFWSLEEEVSMRYLRELWHKDVESVINQFTGIQALSKRFEDLLLEYFSPAEERSQVSISRLATPQQRVTQYLDTALKTKELLPTRKIMTFITMKCPVLQGQLSELQKQLAVLRGLSLNSYNLKHPITLSGISSHELEPAKMADLLRLVLESRLASSAIYGSCRSLSKSILGTQLDTGAIKPLYLELNLVRKEDLLEITHAPARQCLSLGFFFLVSWPAKRLQMPIELIVEGPLSLESANEREPSLSMDVLRQACELALEGKSLPFRLLSSPGNILGFRSCIPLAEESMLSPELEGQTREILLQPLQTLLYNFESVFYCSPAEEFPLSERYRLAFKIAECGLMLCGTSWFSGLRIQRILRSQKDIGKPRRYVLETELGRADVVNDPKTLQPHIFAVGKLLVEIATGHIILRPLPVVGHREFQYEMSDNLVASTDISSPPLRDAEEVFGEVRKAMGRDYSGSVEFCLRRFQPGAHWAEVRKASGDKQKQAYHEILKEYYNNVYQPLKALVQGHDLAGDGPNSMEGW